MSNLANWPLAGRCYGTHTRKNLNHATLDSNIPFHCANIAGGIQIGTGNTLLMTIFDATLFYIRDEALKNTL